MSLKIKKLRNLSRDERGMIGPIFGLMAVPVIVAAGVAIDYGKAVSHRMELQQALDRATVAICTRGQRSAEEVIRAHLDASLTNMGRSLAQPSTSSTTLPTASSSVAVLRDPEPNAVGIANPKVSSVVDTSFLGLVGINQFDIEVETGIACGSKRLELALMLDTTGSMCWNDPYGYGQSTNCSASSTGNKLHSLKLAVEDVLDIFQTNLEAGKTKIGLVPFSETVNVGPGLSTLVRGTINGGTSQWPGAETYQHPNEGWNYWKYHKISHCVTERSGAEAYTNAPPSTAWVGLNYPNSNGNCNPSAQITPLTSNVNTIRNQVWSYAGRGGTAGHIGTAWAWYLLSPEWGYLWPSANVEQHDPQELVKAAILMTDGEYNTQYCEGVKDFENGWCNSANGSSMHQAAQLCEAMKNDGIIVYTVGFQVPGHSETNPSNQQLLLQNCASDESKYFFPYNGDELRLAFKEIGKQLAAGQIGEAVIQN